LLEDRVKKQHDISITEGNDGNSQQDETNADEDERDFEAADAEECEQSFPTFPTLSALSFTLTPVGSEAYKNKTYNGILTKLHHTVCHTVLDITRLYLQFFCMLTSDENKGTYAHCKKFEVRKVNFLN